MNSYICEQEKEIKDTCDNNGDDANLVGCPDGVAFVASFNMDAQYEGLCAFYALQKYNYDIGYLVYDFRVDQSVDGGDHSCRLYVARDGAENNIASVATSVLVADPSRKFCNFDSSLFY